MKIIKNSSGKKYMMIKDYLQVRMQRSKACINGNIKKERQLDKKLKVLEEELTREDVQELFCKSHAYYEKMYWFQKLESFK